MKKPLGVLLFSVLLCTLVFQANAATNYYSNNFESAASLNDGYWSLHDAQIQAVGNSNALVVDGQATFLPSRGNYDPLNFTVQFDIYHNVRYENNSLYQGPFYEAADSAGNVILRVGYVQKGIDNNLQLMGFASFAAEPGGLTYSHYYFPFDHSADWSTWRLTAVITKTEGPYLANVTVQVNGGVITSFNTGLPRPDGQGELWVSDITNEEIYNPMIYHNLLPLPQAGVPVPTYAPVANSNGGTRITLLSSKIQPVAANGATASYIDNFYYGYANAVPVSSGPTPTPTSPPTDNPTPTPTQMPNSGPTQPPQNESFPTNIVIALVTTIVVVALGVLVFFLRGKRKRDAATDV